MTRRIEFDNHTVQRKLRTLMEQQDLDEDAIQHMQKRLLDLEEHAKKAECRLTKLEYERFGSDKNINEQKDSLNKLVEEFKEFVKPPNLEQHVNPLVNRILEDKLQVIAKKCQEDLENAKGQIQRAVEDLRSRTENTFTKTQQELADAVQGQADLKTWTGKSETNFAKMQQVLESAVQEQENLKVWTHKAHEYLGNLEQSRPREGKTVIEAFAHLEGKITEIKRETEKNTAGASSSSSSGQAPGASGQEYADSKSFIKGFLTNDGELRKLKASLDGNKQHIERVQKMVDELRCHCVHVEGHNLHLDNLQLQVDSLAEALHDAPRCDPCGGATPPGIATCCGLGQPCAANSGTGGGFDGGAAGGAGGPGGGDQPWYLSQAHGGNGECHCRHVAGLQFICQLLSSRMGVLEQARQPNARQPSAHGDGLPLIPPGVPHVQINTPPRATAPLKIGPLGGLETGRLFEDKMTAQADFKFDGQKGGDRWKGKLERYFISKSPALKAVLEWAEKADMDVVTEQLLELATGHALKNEHRETLNGAVWGFLSNCVTGEAETIFKRAGCLNGLDAWRRLVRHIDHGRSIRLEALRTEVRSLHLRPIKNLEGVALGIAEFENKITEYIEAGGRELEDEEMKADLLAILPEGLRENLLWRATDPGDFAKFRNMVQAQAAKVLLNRRRLPVHNVEDEPAIEEDFDARSISTVEDLVAAVRRLTGKPWNGANVKLNTRKQPTTAPGAPSQRPPKCPNCGGEHEKNRCKEPMLPVSERRCWTCNKKGHSSNKCPDKSHNKSIRTVDNEGEDMHCFGISMVANPEGFTQVRRGAKPQPRGATLGDYLANVNKFKILGEESDEEAQFQRKAQRRAAAASAWNGAGQSEKDSVDCASLFTCVPGSKEFKRLFPELDVKTANDEKDFQKANLKGQARAADWPVQKDPKSGFDDVPYLERIDLLDHEEIVEDLIAAANHEQTVEVEVAIDSAAVDNVIGEEDIPGGVTVTPNTTGRHFVGANNAQIKNHGTCKTVMRDKNQKEIACRWRVADVNRPLHAVCQVTGPEEGNGEHDVLFSNKKCVVVPPGVVDKILEKIKPITEYTRKGGLYVANMTLSGFARQGRRR